jgi:hypothetical protein
MGVEVVVGGCENNKPIPACKKTLERGHCSQSKCISPERPGRRLIEEIEFSFRLERAYAMTHHRFGQGGHFIHAAVPPPRRNLN